MRDAMRQGQAFLAAAQLSDGSWPYYVHTAQGYPEPTCYSLLALRDWAGGTEGVQERGVDWLVQRISDRGVLTLEGDDDPNWGTPHVVIALTHLQQAAGVRQKSVEWLLTWQGNPTEPSDWIPVDGTLIGWPWISNTFSWVEPTSYAMLALKLTGFSQHARVLEAEKLLIDRACAAGGWNVGNPVVLGRKLEGFLPTTAVALLALQGCIDAQDEVARGLEFLQSETGRLHSTLSLALTIFCALVYGIPADPYVALLLDRQQEDGSWRQMSQLTALSVLALQAAAGGLHVFKQ